MTGQQTQNAGNGSHVVHDGDQWEKYEHDHGQKIHNNLNNNNSGATKKLS